MRAVLFPFVLVACQSVETAVPVEATAPVVVEYLRVGVDADDALGVCWDCPWGEEGVFMARRPLTDREWTTVIGRVGQYWCAEQECQDCSTERRAECTYSHHDDVDVILDRSVAFAHMYCECPL